MSVANVLVVDDDALIRDTLATALGDEGYAVRVASNGRAALVTIGAFIIHVYMGTAMERGAFGSVIRGDVSIGWAKRYHRVWFERLARDAAGRK